MAKYTAKCLDDRGYEYLVTKRRWFGLAASQYRIARWDGYEYGSNTKPDFHWENAAGEKTRYTAHFRARWALLREWKRVRGEAPALWSSGVPYARLLKEGK